MQRGFSPAEHLEKNPDLISERTLDACAEIIRGGWGRPYNERLAVYAAAADLLRLPNEYRPNYRLLRGNVDVVIFIMRRAIYVKVRGLSAGAAVRVRGWEGTFVVESVQRDYLVRLKGVRSGQSPSSVIPLPGD